MASLAEHGSLKLICIKSLSARALERAALLQLRRGRNARGRSLPFEHWQISYSLFDLGQKWNPVIRHSCLEIKKEVPVPVDSLLVAVAVLSVFVIFAGVLMWVDVRSGP